MTKEELFGLKIEKPSEDIFNEAKAYWDSVAKPLDGMGDFEEMICKLAAIEGKLIPEVLPRKLLVFCADNGVVEEGISQSSNDITRQVAFGLGNNTSSACCLAKSVNTEVSAVDIGIAGADEISGIKHMKIAGGSKNFLKEAAMTEEETLLAISSGIKLVSEEVKAGTRLILTGEMGIGNTTTSTAVLAALLGLDSKVITGRGAGLDDRSLIKKKWVIEEGIKKYSPLFEKASNEKERSFAILSSLGGFDIAAMCGAFIGGALYKVPVVIDGLISAVSALLAERFVDGITDYLLASHSGREKGIELVLKELNLKSYIDGNMALGEGTGALMLMPLIDSSLYFYKNGLRFVNAGIENYERFEK